MDGNVEWQQHRVKERIEARLQEAEAQRLVNEGRAAPQFLGRLKASLLALKNGLRRRSKQDAPREDVALDY